MYSYSKPRLSRLRLSHQSAVLMHLWHKMCNLNSMRSETRNQLEVVRKILVPKVTT
jgi:hypothetical protein